MKSPSSSVLEDEWHDYNLMPGVRYHGHNVKEPYFIHFK